MIPTHTWLAYVVLMLGMVLITILALAHVDVPPVVEFATAAAGGAAFGLSVPRGPRAR